MVRLYSSVNAIGAGFLFNSAFGAAHPHHALRHVHHGHAVARDAATVPPLDISIKVNTLAPTTGAAHSDKPSNLSAYITGNKVTPPSAAFMLKPGDDAGTSSYYTPTGAKSGAKLTDSSSFLSWKIPDSGTEFKTPGEISSGRIYIVDGNLDFFSGGDGAIVQPDPHNPGDVSSRELWGFFELSHINDPSQNKPTITINLSFVDWVGMALGMNVTYIDGNQQKTISIPGMKPDGLVNICNALTKLDSFWPKLCMKGADNKTPIRIVSPNKYLSLHPDDKDASTYYEPYVDMVWNKYKSAELKINTQADGPSGDRKIESGTIVTCKVNNDKLECDNDAGSFARPNSADIFGCNSGPFANPGAGETESWSRARVRPRLCAAFVRSTAHLDGAQPSKDIPVEKYYQHKVTNHYSRAVHENLIGGMGYAFSYDDVSADEKVNSAGLVSVLNPVRLDLYVNAYA